MNGEKMISRDDGKGIRTAGKTVIMSALLLSVFIVFHAFVKSGSAAPEGKKKLDELSSKLAWVREELQLAQVDINKKNKEYLQLEHDIVYSNKPLSKLYADIKSMEKEILNKRKALQEEMMKSPEMRKVIKEQLAVSENQRRLRDQEGALLKEIAAEEKKAAPVAQSAGK